MRQIFAVLLCLLCVLTACQSGTGADSDVERFGATDVKDPLRVCIDVAYNFSEMSDEFHHTAVEELLFSLQESGGLDDVVIEFLPVSGADRENALNRMRTEIMAGGGPDVFIIRCTTPYSTKEENDAIFGHPVKSMENGLFLPLDEYIENNTRFAQWDKFTKVVMDAGRNEEGQQIIPLTYTIPVLCCPQEEFTYTGSTELTFDDMLNKPGFSEAAAYLADCCTMQESVFDGIETTGLSLMPYLSNILGDLADYENEELLFTEEELTELIKEVLSRANEESAALPEGYFESEIGLEITHSYHTQPMTMIPLYSKSGGVTATINSFAAVNRNTKRAEDAFTVIDLLLRDNVQQRYHLYYEFLYGDSGIPMNETLMTQQTPLIDTEHYLSDTNYQELCKIRSQITKVNFSTEISQILHKTMLLSQLPSEGETVESIVAEKYADMQRRIRE